MLIILTLIVFVGLGTIIHHLINLRDQNNIIIEILNEMHDDAINEKED
ncbi:hypothetical protein ACFSKI_15270 [Pseudogracilibacillus auburnensis]|uniref:Uncharacterized protein n=1 Tax=Pseudogracilibacillus auburnensis TaxID=1494959 RepID=A0A2V3VL05_9BACI|nr:hypothetical protein [Pseudogracilibacillus auburnensis]PXW82502.1 hypothetical protein DFR56_11879 [Pseudogracilibacillus auburnensis]